MACRLIHGTSRVFIRSNKTRSACFRVCSNPLFFEYNQSCTRAASNHGPHGSIKDQKIFGIEAPSVRNPEVRVRAPSRVFARKSESSLKTLELPRMPTDLTSTSSGKMSLCLAARFTGSHTRLIVKSGRVNTGPLNVVSINKAKTIARMLKATLRGSL